MPAPLFSKSYYALDYTYEVLRGWVGDILKEIHPATYVDNLSLGMEKDSLDYVNFERPDGSTLFDSSRYVLGCIPMTRSLDMPHTILLSDDRILVQLTTGNRHNTFHLQSPVKTTILLGTPR